MTRLTDLRPPLRTPVGVVGAGLIGGSLLLALKERGIDCVAWSPSEATRSQVADSGIEVAEDLPDLVLRSGLLVLAAPLTAFDRLLSELAEVESAHPGSRDFPPLTDVGSAKAPVSDLVRRHLPGCQFVGGHPMAGTERSGFAAADPALFAGAKWVLTYEPDTDPRLWLALADLVTRIGATAVICTAAAHDHAVARVSHLPHLFAATLALLGDEPLARALAAGSYRDGTRVAATRAELTAAMCAANAEQLDLALSDAIARLTQVRELLGSPEQRLTDWFQAARSARRAWEERTGDTRTTTVDAGEIPVPHHEWAASELLADLAARGTAIMSVTECAGQLVLHRG